jgi:myosin heavy subunit
MSKIYRLYINNFLTVEKMTFDLEGVKGFVGKNAQGKSNILLALDQLLRGGDDTNFIQDGKDRYEIRLDEIVDGEVINRVQRVQTQTGNSITGKLTKGTPKQYLETLIDDIAVNPIRIIEEDPVKYLKSHMVAPLQDGDIISHEFEIEFDKTRNVFNECKRHQDYFDKIRSETYGVLRHEKEICSELQKTLPDKSSIPSFDKEKLMSNLANVNVEIGKAEKIKERKDAIESDIVLRMQKIDELRTKYSTQKAANSEAVFNYQKESGDKISKIKTEILQTESDNASALVEFKNNKATAIEGMNSKIKLLTEQLNQLIKERDLVEVTLPGEIKKLEESQNERLSTIKERLANAEAQQPKEIDNLTKIGNEKLQTISMEADIEKREIESLENEKNSIVLPEIMALKLSKQEIENDIKQADNFANAMEAYKKLALREKEVKDIQTKYDRLDEFFKHYAYDLPKKLITRCQLPVEGLEFKEDELYVNGRQYKRLSQGERLMIAGKLAVNLAKRKGQIAVCLDGIEILDPGNRKALIDYMQQADIAVLYTRQGTPEYDHEVKVEKGNIIENDEKQVSLL